MKTEFPDGIDLLKGILLQHQAMLKQQAQMKQQQAQLHNYAGQVAGYEREIERLKAQLDKLRRILFGQSSEKLRLRLEKEIHEAEKRLGEMEDRLNTAKGCLEAAAAVLSEKVSEQLDIINNAFKVIETVRPKLACRKCDAIVQAPLSAKPIDRSYASPGLLARILMARYVEHIPLYRQCDIYARHGLRLSRNTLVRWVLELADKLSPLAELTTGALRRIAELYAIEADIRGSPEETRLSVRKEKSQPLMQSLYGWIQAQLKTLSVHAEMAKAFGYMLKQCDALNVFCSDGRVEIDNNICENALRCVALGRRNYLFFGSDRGGEAAAIIYSLLGTCKLNGVEPGAWLRDVLWKISDWPSNRVHELLPWSLDTVK